MYREALEYKLEQLHQALSELRPSGRGEKHLASIVVTDQIDRWGNYLYVDPQAEDLLGYSPSHYKSEFHWVVYNHPHDIWRTDILWRRALDGYPIRGVEYRTENLDGDWVWLEDNFEPLEFDSDGRVLLVEGRWRDITPRKRREIEFLIRQFETALREGVAPAPTANGNVIQFRYPRSRRANGRRRAAGAVRTHPRRRPARH